MLFPLNLPERRQWVDLREESRITTEVEGSTCVVSIHGRMTIGTDAEVRLQEVVAELLGQEISRIVIDLREVTKIDSSGIGELVAAYRSVTEGGGRLEMRNLPPKTQDILSFTRSFES